MLKYVSEKKPYSVQQKRYMAIINDWNLLDLCCYSGNSIEYFWFLLQQS